MGCKHLTISIDGEQAVQLATEAARIILEFWFLLVFA